MYVLASSRTEPFFHRSSRKAAKVVCTASSDGASVGPIVPAPAPEFAGPGFTGPELATPGPAGAPGPACVQACTPSNGIQKTNAITTAGEKRMGYAFQPIKRRQAATRGRKSFSPSIL